MLGKKSSNFKKTIKLICYEYIIYHMADSVYFGDMMRTLHEILDELKIMNKKLDKVIGEK